MASRTRSRYNRTHHGCARRFERNWDCTVLEDAACGLGEDLLAGPTPEPAAVANLANDETGSPTITWEIMGLLR